MVKKGILQKPSKKNSIFAFVLSLLGFNTPIMFMLSILLGLIGLLFIFFSFFFAKKQQNIKDNSLNKSSKIINYISILSLVLFFLGFIKPVFFDYLESIYYFMAVALEFIFQNLLYIVILLIIINTILKRIKKSN